MQGENAKGDIVGLIATARAQLYVLEQAMERDDATLANDFAKRLTDTAGELRAEVLLNFPMRYDADEYRGEPVFHYRV